MEADYTKRELDEHFNDMKERFNRQDVALAKIDKKATDIDTKVGIQNGRVGKLETKWNSVVIGGIVGMALIGTIITLVVYSFKLSQENLKNTILLELKK